MLLRFGQRSIDIEIGEGESTRTFSINETLASRFSGFIAAALKHGWKDSEEWSFNLSEEDDGSLFEIFEAFIYTGRIFSKKVDDVETDEDGDMSDRENTRLASLWVLGEKLRATAFQDAVVDATIEKLDNSQCGVPLESYRKIYRCSSRPSPMKDLHADIAIWYWAVEDFVSDEEEGDLPFFVDLSARQQRYMVSGRPKQAPWKSGSTCLYHEHGDAKPCYKAMFW